MKIIITTFDGHRNLLEANKYTMDRHGGDCLDVTVLGFKRPDFDMGKWKFVSMGEYVSADRFTDDIAPFFHDLTDEYFIMGNDDVVLTNEFNYSFLNQIIDTIEDIPNFGRIWLTGGSCQCKPLDNHPCIGEIPQGARYRLSLQYSLWKTSYFKRYLKPKLSPWEWELRNDAMNDGAAILVPINNFVVSIGHIMKKGVLLKDWNKAIYGDGKLSNEDFEKCKEILTKHGYK